MSRTKRYESATGAEKLQIQQADRLSSGWSLLNDEHIVTAILWLMAIAGSSATLTAIVQLSSWQPLGMMFLFIVLTGAIVFIVVRRSSNHQRFFLVSAIVLGFVFAVCWTDVFAMLLEAIEHATND